MVHFFVLVTLTLQYDLFLKIYVFFLKMIVSQWALRSPNKTNFILFLFVKKSCNFPHRKIFLFLGNNLKSIEEIFTQFDKEKDLLFLQIKIQTI